MSMTPRGCGTRKRPKRVARTGLPSLCPRAPGRGLRVCQSSTWERSASKTRRARRSPLTACCRPCVRAGSQRTRRSCSRTLRTASTRLCSGGAGYKLDPALRIFTFYDEAIIPAGSAQATIRTTRQVCGESPLEILFGFFCSRQQPGSGYVFACAHVCVRVWACARTNKLVLQQTRIAYGLVGSAFRREPICAKLALDQIAPCSLAAALEKVSRQISSRGWPFCALVGLWYSPR